jgi:hypothetical protein
MIKTGYSINDVLEKNTVKAWESIIFQRDSYNLKDFFLYLNNDIYDLIPWHIPPEGTIAAYEVDHARKLRDTYDYIRLWYSGGSDSHSMVESFLRGGYVVDEILCVFWKTVGDSVTSGDGNQPVVLDWLKELYQKYNQPIPKVTIVSIDKHHVDQHFSKNFYLNYSGYAGAGTYNFNQYGEIAKLAKTPAVANYCEVLGLEKPRIIVENFRAYFCMNDRQLLHASTDQVPIEWFYLPRFTPDLVRAQLWSIMNHVKINYKGKQAEEFLTKLQINSSVDDHCSSDLYNLWCMLCGRTSSPKQNTMSMMAKPSIWTKYQHLNQAITDQDSSWNNYCEFLNLRNELATQWDKNQKTLPGIITKKYFLTDL